VSEAPTLTEQDDGRTVEVRTGQTLAIDLPENAATGYRWAVERLDGPVEPRAAAPRPAAGAVGSGGRTVLAFAATAPGRAEIALKHWRAWEGDASVIARFRAGLRIVP